MLSHLLYNALGFADIAKNAHFALEKFFTRQIDRHGKTRSLRIVRAGCESRP
jgi:hypothetical protein